jgi:hypothetical protein
MLLEKKYPFFNCNDSNIKEKKQDKSYKIKISYESDNDSDCDYLHGFNFF